MERDPRRGKECRMQGDRDGGEAEEPSRRERGTGREGERESQQRAGTPQAWYSDPEGLKSVAEGGTSSPRDGLPVMADHSGSGGGGGCGRRRNGVGAERKAAWSSCPARRICIAGYFYHAMTSLVPCGSCLSLRPPRGRKGEQQSGRASDHAVEHVAVTSRPVCVSGGWLAGTPTVTADIDPDSARPGGLTT